MSGKRRPRVSAPHDEIVGGGTGYGPYFMPVAEDCLTALRAKHLRHGGPLKHYKALEEVHISYASPNTIGFDFEFALDVIAKHEEIVRSLLEGEMPGWVIAKVAPDNVRVGIWKCQLQRRRHELR